MAAIMLRPSDAERAIHYAQWMVEHFKINCARINHGISIRNEVIFHRTNWNCYCEERIKVTFTLSVAFASYTFYGRCRDDAIEMKWQEELFLLIQNSITFSRHQQSRAHFFFCVTASNEKSPHFLFIILLPLTLYLQQNQMQSFHFKQKSNKLNVLFAVLSILFPRFNPICGAFFLAWRSGTSIFFFFKFIFRVEVLHKFHKIDISKNYYFIAFSASRNQRWATKMYDLSGCGSTMFND